jgi:hypothetical protein
LRLSCQNCGSCSRILLIECQLGVRRRQPLRV